MIQGVIYLKKVVSYLDFDSEYSCAGWKRLFYLLYAPVSSITWCQYWICRAIFQTKFAGLYKTRVLCSVCTVSLSTSLRKVTKQVKFRFSSKWINWPHASIYFRRGANNNKFTSKCVVYSEWRQSTTRGLYTFLNRCVKTVKIISDLFPSKCL